MHNCWASMTLSFGLERRATEGLADKGSDAAVVECTQDSSAVWILVFRNVGSVSRRSKTMGCRIQPIM
jgi:hypothetical protein